jgi:cell wall-associated NlpC family hydrolase
MKTFKLYALLFLILFSGITCKKDTDNDDQARVVDEVKIEALTPEQNAFWESQENFQLNSGDIILPNGFNIDEYLLEMDPDFYNDWNDKKSVNTTYDLGPQDSKNLLIAKMTKVALFLTNRNNFIFDKEGDNKPAQNGLSYSYGSRIYHLRQLPPAGKCSDEVYGLDCSGFVYQVFLKAGIYLDLPTYADLQRQPKTIEDAIKAGYPEMTKIKVEDLGKLPTSKFESGDIIYWKNENGEAYHIGIVLKDGTGKLGIAQSNGVSNGTCENNYGINRGPRFCNIKKAILPVSENGFGDNYGIVRINADISGSWKLYLRCIGTTTDAITFDLAFPTSETNTFTINGTGIDYDGSPFDCTGSLQYDNSTNTLSGTLYITKPSVSEFYRYDSFSIKLDRDQTDYFSFTLGESQNAGCIVEGRLVNQETMPVKKSLMSGFK